jgi:hypothetical protein
MNKMKIFHTFIIIVAIFLTACSTSDQNASIVNSDKKNAQSTYNPFDLGDETDRSIEFGFGPVSPVDELTYTGVPIKKNYFYDNSGNADCEFGFMIFIDGIAQAYKINGKKNEEIMHQFSVPKKTKIQFDISLKPSIGKKGDKLGMYVVTIFNPTYMPSTTATVFGNNHALSQATPVNLNYIASANSQNLKINNTYSIESATDKVKGNKYVPQGSHAFSLEYQGDYRNAKIELKKNSKLSLTLRCLCDPEDAKYRTTIFIDNKPAKTVDGKEYMDIQLKKGMVSKQNFDVDISGLKGKHILSTISGPIGNDSKPKNPIVQSDCKLLVIGE